MGTRTVTSEAIDPSPWGESPLAESPPVLPSASLDFDHYPEPSVSNVTLALNLPEREQHALDSLPSEDRVRALELLDTLETNPGSMAGDAYYNLSLLFGFEPSIPHASTDSYRQVRRGLDVSGTGPITHPSQYVRASGGSLWDDVRETSSSSDSFHNGFK